MADIRKKIYILDGVDCAGELGPQTRNTQYDAIGRMSLLLKICWPLICILFLRCKDSLTKTLVEMEKVLSDLLSVCF